ncbi:PASTA domain-containing protein [Barnesiella sp. WM24]|uniref:PASTA domain-containing protein n=1 Tax=Barnesiella sp. WM24 TaxID=2558278 RepID=UPI000A8C69E0|nr:PASTA domain-containing protein [Barnesiella sp. WM24]MDE6115573.1 PASTA domain-containing protein [Muribaculum sp.]TFU95008.1 PASTA domain-containing protein [Barnesiella sp. WM24]
MEETSKQNKRNFIKDHPILFNFLLILLAGCGVIWITLIWLDIWTEHGKYEVVPNIKGLSYEQAATALRTAGLEPELSDSIYDDKTRPGTVIEQSPRANTKVKPNRTVYLTVIAFTPKMISVPDLADMSLRQARSTLEGLGVKNIKEQYVASEYRDLVLAVKFNGVTLRPGARIPSSATVTLEVGQGIANEDDSMSVAEAILGDEEAAELDIN